LDHLDLIVRLARAVPGSRLARIVSVLREPGTLPSRVVVLSVGLLESKASAVSNDARACPYIASVMVVVSIPTMRKKTFGRGTCSDTHP
jgi:hypothetical protein